MKAQKFLCIVRVRRGCPSWGGVRYGNTTRFMDILAGLLISSVTFFLKSLQLREMDIFKQQKIVFNPVKSFFLFFLPHFRESNFNNFIVG
ncbi:hypothetical protein DQK91_01235 [Oceanidesulfovibrio marinus]|uniref:Uncharacterized protein n=1 Tax=Oceanidesulfovibrio marinus TaxID=370038 RepID=A0A6P1ZPV6_9BACT|nr:hypothetical protein DQK91_01235 [Oceanidesulfovibrio marinus]